jgi:hypothetical protein
MNQPKSDQTRFVGVLKPSDRNSFVQTLLAKLIERVKAGEGPAVDRYPAERKVLERLIPIRTDGFRGITLTAIMGKMIREDINTGTEFDSINPRGVFEQGIRPVLKKYRVPTGASPPLNVAKNVQVLDEKWAEGRKPEDAALAAVDYIRRINRHWGDPALRDDLIMMFLQRLVAYAEEVGSHDVELPPLNAVPPVTLGFRLANFSIAFPEGGSVPQFVVGSLLAAGRSSDGDYLPLGGVEASVFGTNSTSSKPADLWETLTDTSLGNLYEVTCKSVDEDRLNAAVDSFGRLGLPNTVITFVCRMPRDAASLNLEESAIVFRGVTFQFVDITALIVLLFVLLNSAKQKAVLERIAEFVADPSRQVKTKQGWAQVMAAA